MYVLRLYRIFVNFELENSTEILSGLKKKVDVVITLLPNLFYLFSHCEIVIDFDTEVFHTHTLLIQKSIILNCFSWDAWYPAKEKLFSDLYAAFFACSFLS